MCAPWFAKRLVNAFRLQIRQKETSITNDEDVGIGKLLVSKRTQLKWRKIKNHVSADSMNPCFCCRNPGGIRPGWIVKECESILLDPRNCYSLDHYMDTLLEKCPFFDMTSRRIEQMMAPSWSDLFKVIDGCPSQKVKSRFWCMDVVESGEHTFGVHFYILL